MSIRTRFNPLGTIGRKSLLPVGYIELEYLESTGTQWIDTGIKPSQFDEFEIEYENTKGVRDPGNYFGVDNNVSSGYIAAAITAYNTHQTWFAYGNSEVNPGGLIKSKTKYKVDATTAYLTYGGVTKTCVKSGTVVDVSMYLFRANGAAAQTTYKDTGLRIYYSWMRRAAAKVQHLVPALDPTGRPCMYDLVKRKTYYNQGTGEFLWGGSQE